MRDAKLKNYLHLHLIVFIWGFTAVLGALISLESLPLVWYRMSLAVLFIMGYMIIAKVPFQLRGTHKLSMRRLFSFVIGGFIIALHWVTFFGAIKVSNVAVTLATLSTGAFFTAIIEPLFTRKKFVLYEIFFGLAIIAALVYMFQVDTTYLYGMMLALASAFLSASFSVLNVRFVKEHHPATISFYELLSGVGLLTVLFMVLPFDFVPPFVLSYTDWLWLLVLASVCTAYAFIASVGVMKELSAYTVMLTINLEPVYGIVLAYLVLDDNQKMEPRFYIGAVVILLVIAANGLLKTKLDKKLEQFS